MNFNGSFQKATRVIWFFQFRIIESAHLFFMRFGLNIFQGVIWAFLIVVWVLF